MKKFILIFLMVAQSNFLLMAQNNLPIPTPQPLPSPTLYVSNTEVVATSYPLQDIDDSLATIEAELALPIQIQAPSEVNYLANAFGFIRYLATNDKALFGVFSPIFSFLMFLTPIALVLLVAYVGNLVMTTIYSVVSDIIKKIQDTIPG
jgi:hypothetical protein